MIRHIATGGLLLTMTVVVAARVCPASQLPTPSTPSTPPEPISSKSTRSAATHSDVRNVHSRPARSDQQLVSQLNAALAKHRSQEARNCLKQLETLRRQQYPPEDYPHGHPLLVDCLKRHAFLCKQTGQLDQILKWSRQALAMHSQLEHAADDPDQRFLMADLLNSVGTGYHYQREYEKALIRFRKSAQLLQTDASAPGGERDKLLATVYCNIGNAQMKLNRYANAAEAFTRSVKLQKTIVAQSGRRSDQQRLAEVLRLCGRALARSSRFAESIRCLQTAVDIHRRRYAKDQNPLEYTPLASALREVASVHLLLGDTAKAKHCLHESLAMITGVGAQTPHGRLVRVSILDALLMVAITEGDLKETRQYRLEIEAILRDVFSQTSGIDSVRVRIDYLHNLAMAFQKAGQDDVAYRYFNRCLALWDQCRAANPSIRGEPVVVRVLSHMGNLLQETGRDDKAFAFHMAARKMAVDLFPTEKYPKGHELIVLATLNLATHCWMIGETASARQWYHDALLMSRQLWSGREYPAGQRLLMAAYKAWANVLMRENQFDLAGEYLRKAQQIAESLYPESQYPEGHFELERCWIARGDLAWRQGEYDVAHRHFQRALKIRQHRVADELTDGDAGIAAILVSIGRTYHAEGNYQFADQFLRRSLDMLRRLYPEDAYDSGHPSVARGSRLLGQLCFDAGQYERAFQMACQSTRIECKMVAAFCQGTSESQLLNFAARRLQSTDLLLSSWQKTGASVRDVYAVLWRRRGLVTRLIRRRQQRLRNVPDGPATELLHEYDDARRRLAHSLLVSGPDDTEATGIRLARMRKLNSRKEELERRLSAVLATASTNSAVAQQLTYADLLGRLPTDAVMVDFVYYARQIQAADRPGQAGHREQTRICAFVLEKKQEPLFVDLGNAQEIESLVRRWSAALQAGRWDTVGRQLRDRIWTPVARHFPATTQTVYVCPDGQLSRVPWAALPLGDGQQVLLEQFAIAVIPNGVFLAEQFHMPRRSAQGAQTVLAVGDVDYGIERRSPSGDTQHVTPIRWQPLSGTRRELDALGRLAGQRNVVRLTGKDATIRQVCQLLPKARWAHFATHGFFVDTRFQAALGLAIAKPPSGTAGQTPSRTTVLQRNPFLLSGLALAGANEPIIVDAAGTPQNEGGILTADGIVSLDCTGLDLVVLSACRTSLGDLNLGDGAYGLQNAFQVAGARNVVASLWDVDDDATTRLMRDFYQLLWQQGRSPLQALRQAQLRMLYHDGQHGSPSPERGPVLASTVRLKRLEQIHKPEKQPSIACWAAFSLSGPGF